MNLGIKNKTAVVTGASRGIGKAVAFEFAREGVNLVLCARNKEELDSLSKEISDKFSVDVLPVETDLTKSEDIKRAYKEAENRFGKVDILVNNTGGPPAGFLMGLSDEEWINAFNLNLMSIIRLTREVLPGMRQRRWGRIVNMISFSIKQPIPDLILSNTIRNAVPGFSKTISDEVAKDNVLVNNICPGYTETDRLIKLASNIAKRENISVDEARKRWIKDIPAGRLASPDEISGMVVFLASEKASYITGQTIVVDGGFYKGVY